MQCSPSHNRMSPFRLTLQTMATAKQSWKPSSLHVCPRGLAKSAQAAKNLPTNPPAYSLAALPGARGRSRGKNPNQQQFFNLRCNRARAEEARRLASEGSSARRLMPCKTTKLNFQTLLLRNGMDLYWLLLKAASEHAQMRITA